MTISKEQKVKMTGKVAGKDDEMHEGAFSIDGDKITFVRKQGDQETKSVLTVKKLNERELVLDNEGQTIVFTRKLGDEDDTAAKLVGVWEAIEAVGTPGVGTTVTISKEKKVKMTGKVAGKDDEMHEGAFSIDGDKITFVRKQGDQETKSVLTVKKLNERGTRLGQRGTDNRVQEEVTGIFRRRSPGKFVRLLTRRRGGPPAAGGPLFRSPTKITPGHVPSSVVGLILRLPTRS